MGAWEARAAPPPPPPPTHSPSVTQVPLTEIMLNV